MNRFTELLCRCVDGICELDAGQLDALEAHYRLLVHWNRILNLTSLKDLETVVRRHYGESLFLGARLPREAKAVADVGSGAGFPGIPVAVLRPRFTVTLIESNQRKAVFLREATRAMKNVSILAKRGESVDEKFDWLVSRAVASGRVLGLLPALAPNIALLVTTGDAEKLRGIRHFSWEEPIPIPWNKASVVLLGAIVPRET
jgi:16S rRNA (guanine527-N7)-methyltransferase